MRHRRSVPKLGVKTAHRKAMLSNMATSLISHGQIETTIGRAKVLAPAVSRLVTLAKRGDIHARRLAATTIRDKDVLKKLFGEVATDLKDKNGGYTRIVRSGFRKGDGASLAIIQLLLVKKVEEKETKKDKAAKKKAKTLAAKDESKKESE